MSKIICIAILFLAVTGSTMAQSAAQGQKIVAACGMDVAVKLQGLAPSCQAAAATAKACPPACVSVINLVKTNSACAIATQAATAASVRGKINKLCVTKGRKLV